jgi:HSP20 family molecular chaperone IbpA
VFYQDELTFTRRDSWKPTTAETLTAQTMKCEFQREKWERTFQVHEEIKEAEIKAIFENAVLTAIMAIVQPSAPRPNPCSQI